MPGPDRPTSPNHARRWLILAVIGIAQLVVVLDVTIVNIALPSAQADLGFSDDERRWVITAYALAFGSLLLLGGQIADLFGRKWRFVAGPLGFARASAPGGASQRLRRLGGDRPRRVQRRDAGRLARDRRRELHHRVAVGGRDLRARCAGVRDAAAIERPPGDGARRPRARGGAGTAATTTATDRPWRADLANAGGGLGLGIIQISAIIPGFLPALALALALVAVVVVPLVALGVLAALLAAPPYGLWRLAARHRRRRSEGD